MSSSKKNRSGKLDFLSRFKSLVDETGDVSSVYGGFEIIVRDQINFPWYKVLSTLVDLDQEIWIEKQSGYLTIKTKPPSM